MAATLRRCEVDVQLCRKENAAVEAAIATVAQDLRRAVVSVQNVSASQGPPPFVDLWRSSNALQESSKDAREKVLQECLAEKRAGANEPGASEEYQSALGDLTTMANRLRVGEADTVAGDAKGLHSDSSFGAVAPTAPDDKSKAKTQMEETLAKLTKLRDKLDDAQLKAQMAGLQAGHGTSGAPDKATIARALRDAVQSIEARAARCKNALASLEELKDEVAQAKAKADASASSVDALNSAVALLGINDGDQAAKSAAYKERQKRLQAQLALAAPGRAKLYAKPAAAKPIALLPAKSIASLPVEHSQDNFTRILPKAFLTDSSKTKPQPEPEPEPELRPPAVSYAAPKLDKLTLPPAPAAPAALLPTSLRPAGFGSPAAQTSSAGGSGFSFGGGNGGLKLDISKSNSSGAAGSKSPFAQNDSGATDPFTPNAGGANTTPVKLSLPGGSDSSAATGGATAGGLGSLGSLAEAAAAKTQDRKAGRSVLTAAQFQDIVVKYYEKVNPTENAQAKAAVAERQAAKQTAVLVAGDATKGRPPMEQNNAQQLAYRQLMQKLKEKYKYDCMEVWKQANAAASPSASSADGPATLKSTSGLSLGAASGAANKPAAQKSLFGSEAGSAGAASLGTPSFAGFGTKASSAASSSSSSASTSSGFAGFASTSASAGTASSAGAFGAFANPAVSPGSAATGFGAFAAAPSAGLGTFGSTRAVGSSAFGSPAAPGGASAFGAAAGVGSQALVPGQLTEAQFLDIVTKYYAKVCKFPLPAFHSARAHVHA